MTYIIVAILFISGGLLLGVGDGGRGKRARYLGTVGGLVWLVGVIYAFLAEGLVFGLVALLVSFVIAAICMKIGKTLVRRSR